VLYVSSRACNTDAGISATSSSEGVGDTQSGIGGYRALLEAVLSTPTRWIGALVTGSLSCSSKLDTATRSAFPHPLEGMASRPLAPVAAQALATRLQCMLLGSYVELGDNVGCQVASAMFPAAPLVGGGQVARVHTTRSKRRISPQLSVPKLEHW